MGSRKITIKQSASESIAAIAFFIESKGMVATAEKFSDAIMTILLNWLIKERLTQIVKNLYGQCLVINVFLIRKNTLSFLLNHQLNL